MGKKFIDGLVKEQLILRDYYKVFGKLNEDESDEDDDIELEPEKLIIPDNEIEDEIDEPEASVDIDQEDEEFEDEEEDIIIEPEEDDINIDIPDAEIDSETAIGTKEPESDGYIRISPNEAQELLSYKGKIFQVVFTKKDGKLRAMNGMTGVRKHTSGGELPYSPKDAGVIPVYDLKIGMGPKGYRMINIAGLKTLHINGKKFKIDQALNEIKINKPIYDTEDVKELINNNFVIGSDTDTILNIFKNNGYSRDKYSSIFDFMRKNPREIGKMYKSIENILKENMKKTELREIVKEIVKEVRGNNTQPNKPLETPVIEPDTIPSKKPKRRTLTPPADSPDTKPKAEGVEQELSNKMADRFNNLK